MTDVAFIFALALGVVILVAMVWISNAASFRLSIRKRQRKSEQAVAAGVYGFMDEEPELDLDAREQARPKIGEMAS